MSGIDNFFAQYLLAQGLDPSLMSGSTGPDAPAPSAGSEAPAPDEPPEVGVIDQLRSNLITRRTPLHPLGPFANLGLESFNALPSHLRPEYGPQPLPVLPEPKPGATQPPAEEPVPLVPPAAPAAAGGLPAVALPPAGAGPSRTFDSNALLRFLANDMMQNRRNDIYDKMLEFGLATMAAAGKPGATTLGAIGEGGLHALKGGREREAAGMKNILEGAQVANVLSEADLRQGKYDAGKTYAALLGGVQPGAGGFPVSEGAGIMGKNQSIIYNELLRLGHSPIQAAAAIGWGMNESGTRDTDTAAEGPYVERAKGKAYGWQQWLGPRRVDLEQYANDIGGKVNDPLVQARFFDNELRTGKAGKLASDNYFAANTIEDATRAMAHFSRTDKYTEADPTTSVGYGQRLANAKAVAARVSQVAQGTSGQTGPAQPAPGAGGDPNAPAGAPAAPTGPVTEETARANIRRYQALGAAAEAAGYSAAASYWYSLSKPPEGYTFTPDGRQVVIQGGPASSGELARTKGIAAKAEQDARAEAQQKIDKARIDMEHSNAKEMAGINYDNKIKEQENQGKIQSAHTRLSESLKPTASLRPNETQTFPPESALAQAAQNLRALGQPLPRNMMLDPTGGVTMYGPADPTYMQKTAEAQADVQMKSWKTARNWADEIRAAEMGKRWLDEGIYSGKMSEWQLAFADVMDKFGLWQNPTAGNTRAYLQNASRQVLQAMEAKTLGSGSGITDFDLKFMQRIANGDFTVPESSLRKLLNATQELARQRINIYNERDAKDHFDKTGQDMFVKIPGVGTVGGYTYGRQ